MNDLASEELITDLKNLKEKEVYFENDYFDLVDSQRTGRAERK